MRWPANTTRRRFVFTPDVVRKRPDDVLAHYHLGLPKDGGQQNRGAQGVSERAAALGLRNWDLFLNMGLAQLENGDLGRSDAQSATGGAPR